MHELALCRQLSASVARASGGHTVEAVFVRIGQLRQVVPDALRHAWTHVVCGTPLDGARLEIESVPGTISCESCGATRATRRHLGFSCTTCGSPRTHVIGGQEFLLTAIDITEAPHDGSGRPTQETRHGALSPS